MKTQIIIILLWPIFLFSSNISYSQDVKACKGYIIIQEKIHFKTGGVTTDSVFITGNYIYHKNSPTPSTIIDYKDKISYFFFDVREKDLFPLSGVGGRYVDKSYYLPDTVCSDSIVYLGERKIIAGYDAQKIQRSYVSPINEKTYPTIAYISDKQFDTNQSKCFSGFILESKNALMEIKTLSIIETMLPENIDFVLKNSRNMDELDRIHDEFESMHPEFPFPTEEEIRQMAKELYDKE